MEVFIDRNREGSLEEYQAFLRKLGALQPGQAYLMHGEVIDQRTLPQNKLYFGLVLPHAHAVYKQNGHTDHKRLGDTHKVMKDLFNRGESTRTLGVGEWQAFIHDVWMHILESFGFNIPLPDKLPND